MKAYYNEHDPKAAAWLRELIKQGHIADGDVDERSIEDVTPADLVRYTQCHFFAGIGVWSYALRRAGWPDDRPVWTGSCPCQPFSAAGKAGGFDDERHLWPAFHYLIGQRRPARVFGEQVASKDADAWIDLVHTDMEAMGYAFGAVPFPSAGIGAPHIRDRLYWVAHADSLRRPAILGQSGGGLDSRANDEWALAGFGSGVQTVRLGQPDGSRPQGGERGRELHDAQQPATQRAGEVCGVGNSDREYTGRHAGTGRSAQTVSGLRQGADVPRPPSATCGPSPTNGLWRDADWLLCRDGKWRPVEPGTFPLAHGAPARVGRLRGYGNAVNAKAAQAFIEAYLGVTS